MKHSDLSMETLVSDYKTLHRDYLLAKRDGDEPAARINAGMRLFVGIQLQARGMSPLAIIDLEIEAEREVGYGC